VLLVYALVNRHNMMDLQSDRSFISNLLNAGLDLFLINWGDPSPEDKYVSLDEYVNGYINDAVTELFRRNGKQPVNLMGICQGGTFSVLYSALYPEKVNNLVTLVTPINFHTKKDTLSTWARNLNVDSLVNGYGNVPGELLNRGFELLKPMLKINKYAGVLKTADNEDQLLNFLRMEYWIADSPSQAGECFRQFVKDLYQNNKLIKGTMELGGRRVKLSNITMPVLNVYAEHDHLVPPESSIALNEYIGSKDHRLMKFSGGHIGVFVGSKSQTELAPGIVKWLEERDNYV
jgi:polyhydroxyalkanoate synthase